MSGRRGLRKVTPTTKAAESECDLMIKMTKNMKLKEVIGSDLVDKKVHLEKGEEQYDVIDPSQPIDISDEASQLLGAEREQETEKNVGTCVKCDLDEKGVDCDICMDFLCFKCEDIKEKSDEWHYYHYLMKAGEEVACKSCKIEQDDIREQKDAKIREDKETMQKLIESQEQTIEAQKGSIGSLGAKWNEAVEEIKQLQEKLKEEKRKQDYIKEKRDTEIREEKENMEKKIQKQEEKIAMQTDSLDKLKKKHEKAMERIKQLEGASLEDIADAKIIKETIKDKEKEKQKWELNYRQEVVKRMKEKEEMENTISEKEQMIEEILNQQKSLKEKEKNQNEKKIEKIKEKEGKTNEAKEEARANEKKDKEEDKDQRNKNSQTYVNDEKNQICKKWIIVGDTCEKREKCASSHPSVCLEEKCSKEEVHIGKECGKLHINSEDIEKMKANKAKAREQELMKKKETEKCRDFMHGYCRYGNRCWREHITLRDFKKTIECKYQKDNRCTRGNGCEYKHMRNQICKYFTGKSTCWKKDSCVFIHKKTRFEEPEEAENLDQNKESSTKAEKKREERVEEDFLEEANSKKRMLKVEEMLYSIMKSLKIIIEEKKNQN